MDKSLYKLHDMSNFSTTRRRLINGIAIACAVSPFSMHAGGTALNYEFSGPAPARSLDLTLPLECTSGTRSQTEGPFYTPSTPQRADLSEPNSSVLPLVLEGLVLTRDCQPIAGAIIDIWHCDDNGRYDNKGFRYRGHQYTDAAGNYRFITNRPTMYTGRTEHIHVKVQGQNTQLLTTQLYFPDRKENNAKDWIFKNDLVMELRPNTIGWIGRFDFVL